MPKYHFPTKEERAKLIQEMQALAAQQPQANQLFQDYANAVAALDKYMSELSLPAADGLPPALTKESTEELQRLISEAAKAGELYLADAGVPAEDDAPAAPLPGVVNKLQDMLATDFKALGEYDASKPVSLPELQSDARGLTIDLRNRNLDIIGNKSNQRHFMTVVDGLGRKRSGVFTKAVKVEVKSKFLKLLDDAKALCGDKGKKELDKLVPGLRNYFVSRQLTKISGEDVSQRDSDDFFIGLFLKFLHQNSLSPEDQDKNTFVEAPVKYEALKAFMKKAGVNIDAISAEAQVQLMAGLDELTDCAANDILTVQQELTEGARVDSRNTAMSQMAALLGVSSLLAKSENMKFIGENGKVTEGTFMDYADGVDLFGNKANFSVVSDRPFDDKACRNSLFRQIADIQILDFLALNMDRHIGNIVYKINRDGQIYGIQGIDNDSSFGNAATNNTSLDDLRVISGSMAARIEKMTPEMLKFSLRGSGLPEKELDRSVERLRLLQEGLKTGRLKKVPDDKFARLQAKDIEPKGDGTMSLFSQVIGYIPATAREAHKYFPRQRIRGVHVPEFTNVSTTDRDHTVGGVRDSVADVARMVENKETNFRIDDLVTIRGKSGKFKELMDQVKKTAALQDGLFENKKDNAKWRADDAMSIESAALLPTLSRVDDAFIKLGEKADAYLAMKMSERKAKDLKTLKGKNPYEQKHIDYAKNIRRIVGEYKAKTANPKNEAEKQASMEKADRALLNDLRQSREAVKKFQEELEKKNQNPGLNA